MRSAERDRLLDAWRGLSVCLVIVHHAVAYRFHGWFAGQAAAVVPPALLSFPRRVLAATGQWLLELCAGDLGALGVQFFFVISGYLITAIQLREFARDGRVSLAAFYCRRAFRILPALWLVIGVTLAAGLAGLFVVQPRSFVFASLFLCNVEDCQYFVGHTWSLAVEEQFYLAWPMLLMVALRLRCPVPLCLALTVTLCAMSVVPSLSSYNVRSFSCILIGCLFATSEGFRSLLTRVATVPVLLLGAGVLFAGPSLPHLVNGQTFLQGLLHPLLVGLLVFGSMRYREPLAKRLALRGLARLGLVSYGVYLWQQIFLGSPALYRMPWPASGLLLLPVIVVVSWHWLEQPLLEVGARWSRRLTHASSAVTSSRYASPGARAR